MNSTHRLSLAAIAGLLVAAPALAASLRVSSGGLDAPSCGSGPNPPCASIGQAVTNASAGDSILVGPGVYSGFVVNKSLRLSSANGTGGAVITGTVTLAADRIVFGKLGKGFSLSPAGPSNAIVASGNDITVRGNIVSDCSIGVDAVGGAPIIRDNSFDSCAVAIRVTGSGAQVRRNRMGFINTYGVFLDAASSNADVRENRAFGPAGLAFMISGSGHILRRNLVHGTPGGGFAAIGSPSDVQLLENVVASSSNPAYSLEVGTGWVLRGNAALHTNAPGFYLLAGSPLRLSGNVAIGNSAYGMIIAGGNDHLLENNSVIDNIGSGIVLSGVGTGVQISGGNLYGNTSNCGLDHSAAASVNVDGVYWGDPGGPGAPPADDICGNTAAVSVTNPAAKAAKIKLPAVK